ncbi:MAG: hypothetical protein IPK70_10345 [Flavobacteriales bacterium]|nr:hypothetical protein [Flavobacteriales bacterium]
MIPHTYEDWHRCITVDCGITLTRPFVLERLAILSDDDHPETQRFIQLYGDPHRLGVVAWYERVLPQVS